MHWIVTDANAENAKGASAYSAGHDADAFTQEFKLTGPNGIEAIGQASADTVDANILPWASGACGFDAITFGTGFTLTPPAGASDAVA